MAERSSGVGGWTAALIAGGAAILAACVAAVLTNAFTRNREHRMWLKERLFDACKDLEDSFQQIQGKQFGPPNVPARGSATFAQLNQILKEHNWDTFDNLLRLYTQALTELEMLDTEHEMKREIVRTRESVQAYICDSKQIGPAYLPESKDVIDLFQRRAVGSNFHWTNRHSKLRDKLVQSYIADEK